MKNKASLNQNITQNIFIAHSNDAGDLQILKGLYKQFLLFEKSKVVRILDQEELFKVARDQNEKMNYALEADLMVPLLSADLLNDEDQLEIILERKRLEKEILPVLASKCLYDVIPELKDLKEKMIPSAEESVLESTDKTSDNDSIFSNIVKKIVSFVTGEFTPISIPSGKAFLIITYVNGLLGIGAALFTYVRFGAEFLSFGLLLMFASLSVVSFVKYSASKI
ncbi:hypothetical protein [Portibacter marinus]|uniref:hypothetical protein n=1 Tax=Portibacter marinus TaxID=2898660 RepID=UPI001F44644B|nr:hypothetical protein [Portibacter marinus]